MAADTRCEQQAPLSTVFSTPVSLPTTPQLFDADFGAAGVRGRPAVHVLKEEEEEFYFVVAWALQVVKKKISIRRVDG